MGLAQILSSSLADLRIKQKNLNCVHVLIREKKCVKELENVVSILVKENVLGGQKKM